MNRNYLLCGVGGQGTVLASKVLADAAIRMGEEVKTTETIGMAQRGGAVVSHVRIGQQIHSPLVPSHSANLILAFEPGEAVRNLHYLKADGAVIVMKKAIQPVTASLGTSHYDGDEMIEYLKQNVTSVIVVDGETICAQCGSDKVLNVALLGAAYASGRLSAGENAIKSALLSRLPQKLHELNLKAFELGREQV